MKTRAAILAVIVLTLLSSWEGVSEPLPVTFDVSVLSTTVRAVEPDLAYAINGSVAYFASSTTGGGEQGHLYEATNDTSQFGSPQDPPTGGGADMTGTFDSLGRLFLAELNGSTNTMEVGIRDAGSWALQGFTNRPDRPWFRTVSGDITYLAFTNKTGTEPEFHIELWKNATGQNNFQQVWSNVTGGHNADFVNHTDSALYFLVKTPVDAAHRNWTVVTASTPPGSVSTTKELTLPTTFHAPRLTVDLGGTIYFVSCTNITSDYAVWLHRWNPSPPTPQWVSTQLSDANKTCALPAIVSGAAGRIGVVWYQADGQFRPDRAPGDTNWNLTYRLYQNADTNPQLTGSGSVDNVHEGAIGTATLGDYITIKLRRGDSSGRVAISFSCDKQTAGLACANGVASPVFLTQKTGPGVIQ